MLLLVPAVALVALVATMSRAGPTSPSGQPVSYIVGTVTAGPVCPARETPSTPCPRKPVAGVVITVTGTHEGEVARATTAADGSYDALVRGYGTYVVTAQTVVGMVAPPPVTVTLDPMDTKRVDFAYNTGGITLTPSSVGCAGLTPSDADARLCQPSNRIRANQPRAALE